MSCYHCNDEIWYASGKFISIINWDNVQSTKTVVTRNDNIYSKLDFHIDCFQEIAGKKFIKATSNPDRKEVLMNKMEKAKKAINIAKFKEGVKQSRKFPPKPRPMEDDEVEYHRIPQTIKH